MVVSQGVEPSGSSVAWRTDAGLEPDAVGAEERDGGEGRIADLGGEPDNVVEDGIGGLVEHLVLTKCFDPKGFVLD